MFFDCFLVDNLCHVKAIILIHSVFNIGTLFDANRSTQGSVLILQIAMEVMVIMLMITMMTMSATVMTNGLFM